MRCASVRRSGEEGLCDLLGRQPAHLPQGERNARFRRERWMTARKNQAQPIILEAVLFIGLFRRTPLRFEMAHELVLGRIESCPSTQGIDGFESGRRNQPRSRVGGDFTPRPQAQRSRKGFVHRLLGKIKIPEQADQRGQDSSRIHAIQGVEQFAYLLGGPLGHDDDLSKPAPPGAAGAAAGSQTPERKRAEKLGPDLDEPKLVEAAGVEPASGSADGRGHSMLSLFLIVAPPPREEAKRRRSHPEFVSPLRPGVRSGYTRISRRRPKRVGCAIRPTRLLN